MFSRKSAWNWAVLVVLAGFAPRAISQESEGQPPPAPPVASPPSSLSPSVAAASAGTEEEAVLTPYEKLIKRLEAAESRLEELEADEGIERAVAVEPVAQSGLPFQVPKILLVHDPEVAAAREQMAEIARLELPAEVLDAPGKPRTEARKEKKWYEKYSLRGYTQFRDNETIYHVRGSAQPQSPGDGSVGRDKNFLIRRARLILQGNVSDHVYIYFQNDFASNVGQADINQFPQIRDWYADLFIDTTQINRIRIGQSKVPYGWENLQSSSNRIPLDRNDAFNTAVKNERDLGIFYYWTPVYAQKIFRYVLAENLKGSGNYGVFGLGIYNGQGGSFNEQNENVHVVSRVTWPFQFENGQILELSVQGYTGKYVVFSSPIRPLGENGVAGGSGGAFNPGNTIDGSISAQRNRGGIRDERLGWTAILYPQPIGIQAEWTIGRGPGLADDQLRVEERSLYGGYIMALAKIDTSFCGLLYPFIRWQYYKGGFKAERNAPFGTVNELEAGLEWQVSPALEILTQYTYADRVNTTATNRSDFVSYENWVGSLLRIQVQVNY